MPPIRQKLFRALDLAALLVGYTGASCLANLLRLHLSRATVYAELRGIQLGVLEGRFPTLHECFCMFVLVAPGTLICVEILGGYRLIREQHPPRILFSGIASALVGVATLKVICIATGGPSYSELVLFTVVVQSSIAICFSRLIGRAWFRYGIRQGMYVQNIAIIGWPEPAILVAERFAQTVSASEYKLAGYFSLLANAGSVTISGGIALPNLGKLQDLERVLVNVAIQRIIIVLPENDCHWLNGVIRTCDYFRVTAEILPEAVLNASLVDLVPQSSMEAIGIASLTLAPPDAESDWLYVKRVLDVFMSGVLLILLAPLFLVVALTIAVTTPNLPVFYAWRVVGSRGRRFTGYKFTTMVANADSQFSELAALNEMSGPVFKLANDPRVTSVGKFLRKYSLNELPQLWSVFKGDMSLVGPRPAFLSELECYEVWQKRKLSAQPGITCFWQVRGRNRISSFDDWVQMDLEYIRNRSPWIDCKILARTAWEVLRGSGC